MASFEQLKSKNIRSSLLLSMVISAITVTAGYGIGLMVGGVNNPTAGLFGLAFAAIFAFIHLAVSWRGGADIVLRISGAREIGPDDLEFRKVYNLVDEMRIASGLPMPRVYVVHDPSPNAFATGRTPEDGRVAVTTGLIEILTRDELQGVIAHEMGHIKNRDILFGTIAAVQVGLIAMIADFVMHMVFWGGLRVSNDREGGNAQLILMVAGIAFAILAPIGAMLIQMAISRQREYLADASGAHFTRNPEGLISALEKIGGYAQPMRSRNHGTAHMWISDPFANGQAAAMSGGKTSLFSTHPPIAKRIERLRELGMQVAPNDASV